MKNYKLFTLLIFIGFLFFGCYMPYISDIPTDDNSQQSDSLSGDQWICTRVESNTSSYDCNWKYYNNSKDYKYTFEYTELTRINTGSGITEKKSHYFCTTTYSNNTRNVSTVITNYNLDNEKLSEESSEYTEINSLYNDFNMFITKTIEIQSGENSETRTAYQLELIEDKDNQKIYKYYSNNNNYSLYYVENGIAVKYEYYINGTLTSYSIYEQQENEILSSINLQDITTYNKDNEIILKTVYKLRPVNDNEVYIDIVINNTVNTTYKYEKLHYPFSNE